MNGSDCDGDWETLLDSGQLDANLKKLTILTRPKPEARPENTRVEVICSEEDSRTQFKPSDPVIKIMKRPEKSGSGGGGGGTVQNKPRTEQKSLKQREQEYAEARQRILGVVEDSLVEDTNTVKSPPRSAVIHKNKTNGVSTARHPKGPDGSKGFQSGKR